MQVFLVGFSSFLLCNYTSLPKSSNLPLIPDTNISENTHILWYISKIQQTRSLGKKYYEQKWEVQSKVHFVWNINLILIEICNMFTLKLNSLLLIWVILHNFIVSCASLPFWIQKTQHWLYDATSLQLSPPTQLWRRHHLFTSTPIQHDHLQSPYHLGRIHLTHILLA